MISVLAEKSVWFDKEIIKEKLLSCYKNAEEELYNDRSTLIAILAVAIANQDIPLKTIKSDLEALGLKNISAHGCQVLEKIAPGAYEETNDILKYLIVSRNLGFQKIW